MKHVLMLVMALAGILILKGAITPKSSATKGGSGRVVGVVGRMGSGKSYYAVRMAYKSMLAGKNVCTNFHMNFDDFPVENGKPRPQVPRAARQAIASRWSQFHGWDQFAELKDAVVIIDEAHLYAPSNMHYALPTIARWKMSQARKFGLDIYWISQHEDRVNRVLRDLSNIMYVCTSWAGGAIFAAKGYEPEKIRRKDQHLERKFYRMNIPVANLYDTLAILKVDETIDKGGKMASIGHEVADKYNHGRQHALRGDKHRSKRCAHETGKARVLECTEGCCDYCDPTKQLVTFAEPTEAQEAPQAAGKPSCAGTTAKGAPCGRRPGPSGLCASHDRTARIDEAAAIVALVRAGKSPAAIAAEAARADEEARSIVDEEAQAILTLPAEVEPEMTPLQLWEARAFSATRRAAIEATEKGEQ